jgi:hypothetical protein
MKKTNETDSLNELIALYEQKHDYELKNLKEQFHVAYESLKPFNLIKGLFHEVTTSPEIKSDLASNAIGLGAGFLSKSLFGNYSNHPVKRIIGTAAQFAIGNLVAKHADTIKSIGSNLIMGFFNKAEKK